MHPVSVPPAPLPALLLVLPRLLTPPIWGVYLSQPMADLMAFCMALPMMLRILKRFKTAMADPNFTP